MHSCTFLSVFLFFSANLCHWTPVLEETRRALQHPHAIAAGSARRFHLHPHVTDWLKDRSLDWLTDWFMGWLTERLIGSVSVWYNTLHHPLLQCRGVLPIKSSCAKWFLECAKWIVTQLTKNKKLKNSFKIKDWSASSLNTNPYGDKSTTARFVVPFIPSHAENSKTEQTHNSKYARNIKPVKNPWNC